MREETGEAAAAEGADTYGGGDTSPTDKKVLKRKSNRMLDSLRGMAFGNFASREEEGEGGGGGSIAAAASSGAPSSLLNRRKSRHVRFGEEISTEVHLVPRKRASIIEQIFYSKRDIAQFKDDKFEEEAEAQRLEKERQKEEKKKEKESKKADRKKKLAERRAKRGASGSQGVPKDSDAPPKPLDPHPTSSEELSKEITSCSKRRSLFDVMDDSVTLEQQRKERICAKVQELVDSCNSDGDNDNDAADNPPYFSDTQETNQSSAAINASNSLQRITDEAQLDSDEVAVPAQEISDTKQTSSQIEDDTDTSNIVEDEISSDAPHSTTDDMAFTPASIPPETSIIGEDPIPASAAAPQEQSADAAETHSDTLGQTPGPTPGPPAESNDYVSLTTKITNNAPPAIRSESTPLSAQEPTTDSSPSSLPRIQSAPSPPTSPTQPPTDDRELPSEKDRSGSLQSNHHHSGSTHRRHHHHHRSSDHNHSSHRQHRPHGHDRHTREHGREKSYRKHADRKPIKRSNTMEKAAKAIKRITGIGKSKKKSKQSEDVEAYDWAHHDADNGNLQNTEILVRENSAKSQNSSARSLSDYNNNSSGKSSGSFTAYDWGQHNQQPRQASQQALSAVPELPVEDRSESEAKEEEANHTSPPQQQRTGAMSSFLDKSALESGDEEGEGENSAAASNFLSEVGATKKRRASSLLRLMKIFIRDRTAEVEQSKEKGTKKKTKGSDEVPTSNQDVSPPSSAGDDSSYNWAGHEGSKESPERQRTGSFVGLFFESSTKRKARKKRKEEEQSRQDEFLASQRTEESGGIDGHGLSKASKETFTGPLFDLVEMEGGSRGSGD